MTYQVVDFHGQVIARYLSYDFALGLAARESRREWAYRAVYDEKNHKIAAYWMGQLKD